MADQYFLIAHEDRTGRSRLHPRATGLGLAAGLLGELMLEGRVRIIEGVLLFVSRQPPRALNPPPQLHGAEKTRMGRRFCS